MSEKQKDIYVACSNCGKDVKLDWEKPFYECKSCDFKRDLSFEMFKTKSIPDAYQKEDKNQKAYNEASVSYICSCKECKAIVTPPLDTVDPYCPFCDTLLSEPSERRKDTIQPEMLIPFRIPKSVVEGNFKSWIQEGRIQPTGLSLLERPDTLQAVYIPMLQVSVETRNTWVVLVNMVPSKDKTDANFAILSTGSLYKKFDRLPYLATNGIASGMKQIGEGVDEFKRYDMGGLVFIQKDQLNEWNYEIYTKSFEDLFKDATKEVTEVLLGEIVKRSPGKVEDKEKQIKLYMDAFSTKVQHVLLPVWVGVYTYQKKKYQFLVNGQSGVYIGKKPLSVRKIALIMLGIALFFIILVLSVHAWRS